MATYIPGIVDYIPQVQPFQPDYNFLGNMLQTKQSQYDQNYKQLSQKYGTLLNSDMMRTDNIEKRNEFMKMIDNDIKRISGLDLSLQQNVDSANKVFDSFFQNKDLVKDMAFTKEYQKQLQAGEIMRNCTDQEKCGGKYWDVGMQALHYRAQEFKNASKQDAMSMQVGRFVPQINVQEKTMKYLQDLLGKGGEGGFGVESISYSDDGNYQIKIKNGANLSVPLQQLIQAQYGKDQSVIDMYNTQAYVQRKGYIASNLDKFGGDENAAEDAYFRQLDIDFQKAQLNLQEAQDRDNLIRAKNNALAKQIKLRGTTGNDQLAKDYLASLDDMAANNGVLKHAQTVDSIAKSVFEAGENRAMRRNRADQLMGYSLMNKELSDAAIRAAAMTGSVSVKADDYALKRYDFSLDMAKMKTQYDLADRNARFSRMYDIEKEKAIAQLKKQGSAVEATNKGTYVDGVAGTTSTETINESAETRNKLIEEHKTVQGSANGFTNGYANTLMGIVQDSNYDDNERQIAKSSLEKIYGKAAKDQQGNYISKGYDAERNLFVDKNGNTHSTAQDITDSYNYKDLYGKAQSIAKQYRSLPEHAAYLEREGKSFENSYNTNMLEMQATAIAWKENNKSVKSWGNTKFSGEELANWNNLFNTDNTLKTAKDYVRDYLTANPYSSVEDAMKAYNEMDQKYDKFYNEGNVVGKDAQGKPVALVKSTAGSSNFSYLGGGKSAGGGVMYEFNSENPAALGTKGLVTLYDDALQSGSIWTIGNHATVDAANASMGMDGDKAKQAMQQLMSDLRTGNLTKAEKENIQGQIMYMDLALSDKNKVGATIKFPTSWLQRYQKSAKDENEWADDMRLATEGVSMYVNKNTAKNLFTQSFREQPYDYIVNYMNYTIDVPNGGKVTVNKRHSDGSITVTGNVYRYVLDKAGQLVLDPLPVTKNYTGDVGGQNLYNNLIVSFNELAAANEAYRQTHDKAYIKNPSDLPEIQSQLQSMSQGAADPTAIYMQNVNKQFYGR